MLPFTVVLRACVMHSIAVYHPLHYSAGSRGMIYHSDMHASRVGPCGIVRIRFSFRSTDAFVHS